MPYGLFKKLGIVTVLGLPLVLSPKNSLESSYPYMEGVKVMNFYPEMIPYSTDKKLENKIDIKEELISPYFINIIGWVESKWNPLAVSKKGARGIGQIMRPTWNEFSGLPFNKAFDPSQNIKTCEKILEDIKDYCRENNPKWGELSIKEKREQILAAYNGGKARLKYRNWNILEMPESTRKHIKKFERFL